MFNRIYHNKSSYYGPYFKETMAGTVALDHGANVTGYSLPPPTDPNHFDLLDLDLNSIIGNVCEAEKLRRVFQQQQPEIVFHLAAQPIVRRSFTDPVETFSTNVLGTVNVLQASRETGSVRAIVNITSENAGK
jgi:CDP-glucose 4,6-dehydratase